MKNINKLDWKNIDKILTCPPACKRQAGQAGRMAIGVIFSRTINYKHKKLQARTLAYAGFNGSSLRPRRDIITRNYVR